MFYVNGLPILADDLEVLQELKKQLADLGIKLFGKFKQTSKNIQFSCPHHSGGQEQNPSCGISTQNQPNTPAGTVHCFTCGYIATLEEMISHCFGYDDFGRYGRKWLVQNFLTIKIENRRELELDFNRERSKVNNSYITESELELYRYYHPYMYQRKLTDEIIQLFDIGFDAAFKLDNRSIKGVMPCLTFPVRDIQGGTVFIARRAVNKKFFHYPSGANKPVYGLYELKMAQISEVIICESIIDALTCWVYGKQAVALMGLGTQYQYNQLKRLPYRKYITAFDGDEAGYTATIRLKNYLQQYKLISTYKVPKSRDINDLSLQDFHNLIEVF